MQTVTMASRTTQAATMTMKALSILPAVLEGPSIMIHLTGTRRRQM